MDNICLQQLDLSFHINWICLSQQLDLYFQNIIRFTFSQELDYIFNTITLKFLQYLECQSHIACFISSIQVDVSLSLTFTSCSILQMWPHQGGGGQICKSRRFMSRLLPTTDMVQICSIFSTKSQSFPWFFILVEESAPET